MKTTGIHSGFGTALAVCVCAGGVCGVAQGSEPGIAQVKNAQVVDVAHIYYNLATGEKVVTLMGDPDGQTSGADTGSSVPIWSSVSSSGCPGGAGDSFFFVVDDNSRTSEFATGFGVSNWGDIAQDSVVDCVHIEWITDHDDVDANSDGIGDGVVGLGGQWFWTDIDNGPRAGYCGRMPLISFVFRDLPGDISGTTDPSDPGNTFAAYSVDLDLTSDFSSALSFEICDTDSDPQGAAVFNAGIGNMDNNFDGLPDSDIDGDGLADWGWSVNFFQPGTHDYDSDGVLDGDIADSMKAIGISFGYPEGHAIDNGDGTWTWEIDPTPHDAGFGSEGVFAFTQEGAYVPGVYWFGEFSCDPLNPVPRANFTAQLLGPDDGPICDADCNGDGQVNFFDIVCWLPCFTNQEICGDLNGDGSWDFFDVSEFLSDYAAGCP